MSCHPDQIQHWSLSVPCRVEGRAPARLSWKKSSETHHWRLSISISWPRQRHCRHSKGASSTSVSERHGVGELHILRHRRACGGVVCWPFRDPVQSLSCHFSLSTIDHGFGGWQCRFVVSRHAAECRPWAWALGQGTAHPFSSACSCSMRDGRNMTVADGYAKPRWTGNGRCIHKLHPGRLLLDGDWCWQSFQGGLRDIPLPNLESRAVELCRLLRLRQRDQIRHCGKALALVGAPNDAIGGALPFADKGLSC